MSDLSPRRSLTSSTGMRPEPDEIGPQRARNLAASASSTEVGEERNLLDRPGTNDETCLMKGGDQGCVPTSVQR
jgi:hypothetical protein